MKAELVLILLLFFFNKKNQSKKSNIPIDKDNNILDTKLDTSIDKTINLNVPYTLEKIRIMKKIGSYFPEEFVPILNKSLIITEKIITLYETVEFMQVSEANYIKKTIPVKNSKERLSYIINTIQKEMPKEEIKNMGMAMEMILNMDKYKKMLTILNSVMSDPESLNDPTKMLNLIEPFIQDKDEKEKEKLKDMAKMLEIMKTLDTSKKTKKEDQKSKE